MESTVHLTIDVPPTNLAIRSLKTGDDIYEMC